MASDSIPARRSEGRFHMVRMDLTLKAPQRLHLLHFERDGGKNFCTCAFDIIICKETYPYTYTRVYVSDFIKMQTDQTRPCLVKRLQSVE